MTNPLFILLCVSGDFDSRSHKLLGYYTEQREAEYARGRLQDQATAAETLQSRLCTLMREFVQANPHPVYEDYPESAEYDSACMRSDKAWSAKREEYCAVLGIDPHGQDPEDYVCFSVEELSPGKSPYAADFLSST